MKTLLHSKALEPHDVDEETSVRAVCFDPQAITSVGVLYFDPGYKRCTFEIGIASAKPLIVYGAIDETAGDGMARIMAAIGLEARG